MKNSNLIVHIVFGIAIIVLFVLYAKKPNANIEEQENVDSLSTETANVSLDSIFVDEPMIEASFPIAYVTLDTVMHNYLYYQKLEKRYQNMVTAEENKLKKKAEQWQKDVETFQYEIETKTITTLDAQKKEEELGKRQQSLYEEQQRKEQELAVKEQQLLSQLIDSLHACINFYNADGKYKIILNNAYQSNVLYAEQELNITSDVLKVMNARYNASQKK